MCSTAHVYTLCSLKEKLKALAELLHQALFTPDQETPEGRKGGEGEGGELGRVTSLQQLIMATMIRWAQQPINSPELIQQIFTLLYRQCDEINEVVRVYLLLPCQDYCLPKWSHVCTFIRRAIMISELLIEMV